jgi:transcriptional regulator with GAF, ATPase, and Fis domain
LRRIEPVRDVALTVGARRWLLAPQKWEGNVRELEAVIQRAWQRAQAEDPDATRVDLRHLDIDGRASSAPSSPPAVMARDLSTDETPILTSAPSGSGSDLGPPWKKLQEERDRLDETERKLISAALERYGGVVARAARELDLPRTSLLSRIRTLGIEVDPLNRPKR